MGTQSHTSGTRHRLTRGDIEAPVVLGTFDFGAIHETLGKRCATVCAHGIEGKESIIGRPHDCNEVLCHGNADYVLAGNVIDRTDDVPAWPVHGSVRARATAWSVRWRMSVGRISRSACQMLRWGVGSWSATAACNFGSA